MCYYHYCGHADCLFHGLCSHLGSYHHQGLSTPMETRLVRKSKDATVMLGMVVLITFIFLIFMFYTVSARVKKIKPRSFDEDTNEVAHLQMDWPGLNPPPTYQDPPPTSHSAQTMTSFTNELTFPWYPGMSGSLLVWRTENWRDYTLLYYVLYEEQDRYKTNDAGDVFVVIGFVDQYALDGNAFYSGVIITNSPPASERPGYSN